MLSSERKQRETMLVRANEQIKYDRNQRATMDTFQRTFGKQFDLNIDELDSS